MRPSRLLRALAAYGLAIIADGLSRLKGWQARRIARRSRRLRS